MYSQSIIKLLTKFSHCVNVLQFYGFFPECRQMMQQIWKATLITWQDNQELFDNWIQRRRKLIYHRGFDEEFREFLMQNNKFEQYQLTFDVWWGSYQFDPILNRLVYMSKNLFYSLDKFLDEVEGNRKTKFDKIYILLNYGYKEAFNLFISKHPFIKPHIIFLGNYIHIGGNISFINPLSWGFTSIWK